MSIFATSRRTFLRSFLSCLIGAALVPSLVTAATPRWRSGAPLPVPRTEVAAARLGNEIVVTGGFLASGAASAQVDVYAPATNRWRRLPDLPEPVHHAMAASWRGKLIVAGGYTARRTPTPLVHAYDDAWRALPRMPEARAAAGAAVIGNTLYIVGGVGESGLARTAFALDLVRNRWRTIRGPTPREHLAVTAARGRVYAIAGRTGGLDTNFALVESIAPGGMRWRREKPVPSRRGGTGAATVGRTIVSVGGEAPNGTIGTVYAYDVVKRRWRRLPNLRIPRHGLGVVAFGKRVYVIAGGTRPGLSTSGANEFLQLP